MVECRHRKDKELEANWKWKEKLLEVKEVKEEMETVADKVAA